MKKTSIRKCPQCKKEWELANNPSRPFCSKRCQLIDFGAWASEDYVISEGANTISEVSAIPMDEGDI